MMEQWNVDQFWKNDKQLSYGIMDAEVAVEWSETLDGILQHIGCQPKLWVRVVEGTIWRMGKIWWKITLFHLSEE